MMKSKEDAIRAAYKLLGDYANEAELVECQLIADGLKWCLKFKPFNVNGRTCVAVVLSHNAIDDIINFPSIPNDDYFDVCLIYQ